MFAFPKAILMAFVAITLGAQASAQTPSKAPGTKDPVKPELIKPKEIKPGTVLLTRLQVTYPTNNQCFEMIDKKRVKITVRFTADVDRSTVVAGQSLIMKFPKADVAPGQIAWVNDRELTWTCDKDIHDVGKFTPDCSFRLTLKDSVKSKTGVQLDGDKNGKPGGDYTFVYTLIG